LVSTFGAEGHKPIFHHTRARDVIRGRFCGPPGPIQRRAAAMKGGFGGCF
jgi:hypothetical protein